MASIARVTINWTGLAGGPGYTNLHFAPAAGSVVTQGVVDAAVAKTDVFLNAWMASLPTSVTVGVDPTVEIIDSTNGDLTDFKVGTPEVAAAGGDAGNYAAGAGACLNWYTAGIRNARRVRGRSFIVPLAATAWQTDGTLATAKLVTWRAAAAALIANVDAAKLCIWGRPTGPDATDGVAYDVINYTLPDKSAILRSRRD